MLDVSIVSSSMILNLYGECCTISFSFCYSSKFCYKQSFKISKGRIRSHQSKKNKPHNG